MLNRLRRWLTLLAALLLTGCAISLTDATPVPTIAVPSALPPGQPSPTPFGGATEAGATEPAWGTLGLSGRLLYSLGMQGVHELDLATGENKVIFATPKDGWLTAASVAPDGQHIALAYAPPPDEGGVQLGYTSLYLLPGDCGARPDGCTPDDLTLLQARIDPHEAYFSPIWAANSQRLYTAHFTPSDSGTSSPFKYTLERLPLTGGTAEVLLEDALWPNLSPDGHMLTYVVSDPIDNTNFLYVSDENGANPRVIVTPDQFLAVDAPFFTPDSSAVIFSAVGEGPAGTPAPAANLIDQLLGVRTAFAAAEAHNVPSDWWQIRTDGTGLTRLTSQYDTSMFGAVAPDGQHIAYLSASGLYVMNLDGSDVKRLLRTAGYGTLDWIE